MALSTIGNIDSFDANLETWDSYCERLGQFFVANEVGDDKKKASLLSLIGPKTYTLLRNLCAPHKPSEKSYDELVQLLNAQLNPKPSVIAERYRFHKRNQSANETVMDYVAELRRLSVNCNFNATLSDTLRDRLVCGLRHEYIQKRLLSESELDLDKAIKISVAMETASKDAAEVQGVQEQVHSLNFRKQQKKQKRHEKNRSQPVNKFQQKKLCFRCNGEHSPDKCKHIETICNFCHKKGHIERACLSKKRQNKVHQVTAEQPILHLSENKSHTNPITLNPRIGKTEVQMELDTGTALSLISKNLYDLKFKDYKLEQTTTILRSYSGHTIKPIGRLRVDVSIHDQTANLELYVVPQNVPSLFGRDWLEKLKLNWVEVKSLHSQGRLSSILEMQKSVFSEGIGKLKDIKANLTLKEGAKPKFLKARNVPYSLRPKIEAELDRLQKEGVIEPIEYSEWATPIVPVMKSNG